MRALTAVMLLAIVAMAAAVDVDTAANMRRTEKKEQDRCIQQPSACQQTFVQGGNGFGAANKLPEPDEVVQPIDDWIKAFKKSVGGGSLYDAARATVRPLIERLKRTQRRTQEEIDRSNREIIERVEEAATTHVYNMLRATKIKEDQQDAAREKKEQLKSLKDDISERKEIAKMAKVEAAGAAAKASASSSLANTAAKEEKKLEAAVKKELEKKL